MPERLSGLKGYVGEAVTEIWLKRRFPGPEFRVIRQIMPISVDRKGGPYLDVGVAKGSILQEVYEVKTQVYIPDKSFPVNKSLTYIWDHAGEELEYETQDGEKFTGSANTKAFFLVVCPPNRDFIDKVGTKNLQFVRLLRELWHEIETDDTELIDSILADMKQDVPAILQVMRDPKAGDTFLQTYFECRMQSEHDGGGVPGT